MRFIGHRGKHQSDNANLTLKIDVIQAQNIDVINKFDCNPICFVTTNTYYHNKTNKLKNSNTKWNQILKLKLPKNPKSEWLRVVIYDALPTMAPYSHSTSATATSMALNSPSISAASLNTMTSPSGSGRVKNIYNSSNGSPSPSGWDSPSFRNRYNFDDQEELNSSKTNNYLYLGEVRLSFFDIFKKKDTTTSYNFDVHPAWYPVYDRKRKTAMANDRIGEIQLGFKLESNSKKIPVFQSFNEWKNQLENNLENKKYMHDVTSSQTSLVNPKLSELVNNDVRKVVSESDLAGSRTDSSSSSDVVSITSHPDLIVDEEDLDVEYDILSVVSSNNDLKNIDDGEDAFDLNLEENDEITKDDLFDIKEKGFDLQSMVTVLDEYDVVTPNSSNSATEGVGNIYESFNNFSEGTDDEEMEDTTDISFDSIGNTLLHLKKRTRMKKAKRSMSISSHHPSMNFHISKRIHASGVLYIKFDNIENLPPMKNKISRTTYIMDPFLITTFGRRVFKTSCKKHVLNPTFNEYAAFEVYPTETNHGFYFKVMDKDSFSYNDEVAECTLSWIDMMKEQGDACTWKTYKLPLKITSDSAPKDRKEAVLTIEMQFVPYNQLKENFWQKSVPNGAKKETFDIIELILFFERLGSFTDQDAVDFFKHFGKVAWTGDTITRQQLIEGLQSWNKSIDFRNVWRCPRCLKSCKATRPSRNSKLVLENDLITHFAICTFSGNHKLRKVSYVSTAFASKRWFSKMLIKLTYGNYVLGSNNANILVEDRDTGVIIDEKISAHVKLGMRVIYNGKGTESKKFKNLLKTMSVRQGKKFDSPSSIKNIEPFIKFHSLDLSQCEEVEFKTFNEFFYRKLKAGSRTPEGDNDTVLVSPADSRCAMFSSVHKSKEIWVKGDKFSISRLTRGFHSEVFNDKSCSLGIFRLAPQDYHRFHSPCNGKIGKPIYIEGEYYTVNPMAVRSSLDVFGENVRVIIPIKTPQFGTLLLIAVGAMMVGSIVLTLNEGDVVKRGQEVGYFKFGGSTIILVVPSKSVIFDSDLLKNSLEGIETLVKVGMSIGHSPESLEYRRQRVKIKNSKQLEQIKRSITVTEENAEDIGNVPWQYRALEKFIEHDPLDSLGTSDYDDDEKSASVP